MILNKQSVFAILFSLTFIGIVVTQVYTQNPAPNTNALKKANTRPAEKKTPQADPFDGASIEKMSAQCVTLETEQGSIVIEMLPGKAPESVRSFLNLAATGALDTTTFTRVVKDFVIQGGDLSTSEKWSAELAARMARRLPDEPSDLRHVRGVVSMARTEQRHHAFFHFGRRWTTSRWQVQRVWTGSERNGSSGRNQSRAVGRRETDHAGAHQTRRRGSVSEIKDLMVILK